MLSLNVPFTDTWDRANLLPEEMLADQYQQEVMPVGYRADLEPGREDNFTNVGERSYGARMIGHESSSN